MQRVLAIAWLTWKAALRFRLFLVIAVLLLGSVVGLPLLLKDDGTARGFTQILLTYTLSCITALLGLSTLWLSCGTLARDIEECQMQVVATKPIARWQIWLGKWLGLVGLNAVLLALAGGSVYGLLQWRATHLPPKEQQVLRSDVLVARGVIKASQYTREIDEQTAQRLQERLTETHITGADLAEARQQIREQVKAQYQLVPPDMYRVWQINLGRRKDSLRNVPLQLRIKFNAANHIATGTFLGLWRVGVPKETQLWQSEPMSLAPNTYHEFQIPPNLFDKKGLLTITFINSNNTTLLFPLEDGMEVLYPEGGFGMNYVRGLAIIFCWMALLAALGLTAASFLSFPVAAFFSLGVLTMVFSSNVMAGVVSEGTLTGSNTPSGPVGHFLLHYFVMPFFHVVLVIINLAKNFSPIDALSSGRCISWMELGVAFLQIVVLLGGIIALIGVAIFRRRELATAQGTQ